MEAIRATLSQLKQLFLSAPSRVAARLSRPHIHVLDIGAGKAPWSLAMASRDPSIFVTAADLPDQLAALQHSVNAAGLSRQFRPVSVDVFSPAWPPTNECNLVVIANVCHLFDEQRNRKLLHRAAQCLRPGGTLAIIDQVLDEDPNWERWGALYLLGALHCAPGGYLFPVRKYEVWLNDIDSWQVATHPICPLPPLTLITAVRI
jgi:SAM-dependent methyltransferase